jgi:hypothetical protein
MSFSSELWREDGRLSQSVSNAKEQLQTNERALYGMMDKVSTRASFQRSL